MTALPARASNQWKAPIALEAIGSGVVAFWLCTAIIIGFAAASPDCVHWFLLPLLCCGVLIGSDAVDWLLGRVGLFDPVGVLGVIGFHFFFLAPLLHVVWDFWCKDFAPPPDWRYWLGAMAFVDLSGLLAYRFSRKSVRWPGKSQPNSNTWILDEGMFFPIVGIILVTACILQCYAYAHFGGVQGYIEAATGPDRGEAFRGFGGLFMISETFPILAMMLFAVHARARAWCRSNIAILAVFACFLLLAMVFGGLRGSRSNTIWSLAWAAGIAHVWIRPISMRTTLLGAVLLGLFMYFYGFYKNAGTEALQGITNREVRAELEHTTQRSLHGLLLGDFGRSDVQAFVLYRTVAPLSDYELRWGQTYVGALALLIPRSIVAERPPTKVQAGTEALDGKGAYVEGIWWSARVYGLAGEAMLNFGPAAVPVAFLVFGFAVGHFRRLVTGLGPPDGRSLLAPFLLSVSFVMLAGDSDNLVFDLIKNFAVPFAVVYACCGRQEAEGHAGDGDAPEQMSKEDGGGSHRG